MPDQTPIQVSERTKATIDELMEIIKPAAELIRSRKLTVENAWDDPNIARIRDTLTNLLSRDTEVERLLAASAEMARQHDQLASTTPLTSETLQKMGLLSAGAILLSGEALVKSMRPKAIFWYSLQQIWPWLRLLADAGVEVAHAVAANTSQPQPSST